MMKFLKKLFRKTIEQKMTLALKEVSLLSNNDGIIIVDGKNIEHFFYVENGELMYDGWAMEIINNK